MTVTVRGERELALRFDAFPTRAHERIRQRIQALTAELEARVQAATPVRTGRLRGEITERVFSDDPERIAGYVSVFSGDPREYPKAATLEYGTDKPRRAFEKRSLLDKMMGGRRRIVARLSKPAHIQAYRYLRAPLDAMRPEIEAALDEALAEAAAENVSG